MLHRKQRLLATLQLLPECPPQVYQFLLLAAIDILLCPRRWQWGTLLKRVPLFRAAGSDGGAGSPRSAAGPRGYSQAASAALARTELGDAGGPEKGIL